GAGHSPNEVLTVTVTGIDASWGFSSPAAGGHYDAATGTFTVTLPAGQDLNTTMTFTPPHDSDIDLTGLNAQASAFEPATATTATANDGFNVVVDAVADLPTVDADSASGNESTAIPVTIHAATTDIDHSESITGYKITS